MTATRQAQDDQAALVELVSRCSWLLTVLRVVANSELPDAWVGAGVLRDLVWDSLYGGGFDPANVKDVDVAFFDPFDLSPDRDEAAEDRLKQAAPAVPWDVKNQAAVHLWYPRRFGVEVPPLMSTPDGVATWPETATAVAVRLCDESVDVTAPYGLGDLLGGVWRRNPRRVSPDEYLARIDRKRPRHRWPGVTVLAPDESPPA